MIDTGGSEFARYQRFQLASQVGELSIAAILLLAAAATAVRRAMRAEHWLPDRRTWAIEVAVASAAMVVGLAAVVAFVNDVVAGPERFPRAIMVLTTGNRLGALAVAAVALWLAAPER